MVGGRGGRTPPPESEATLLCLEEESTLFLEAAPVHGSRRRHTRRVATVGEDLFVVGDEDAPREGDVDLQSEVEDNFVVDAEAEPRDALAAPCDRGKVGPVAAKEVGGEVFTAEHAQSSTSRSVPALHAVGERPHGSPFVVDDTHPRLD